MRSVLQLKYEIFVLVLNTCRSVSGFSMEAFFFFDEKDTVLNRHCRSCGFSCPVLRAVTKTSFSSVLATLLFLLSARFHHRDVNMAPQPGAINSIFRSIMRVSAFALIAVLSGGQAQVCFCDTKQK